MLAEFRNIEASSDLESVKERNVEIQNILKAKEQEVEEATHLLREASLLGVQYKNEADEVVRLARNQPDLSELLLGHCKEMTSDQLEADLDSEKARLELAHEGSAGLI